MRHIAMPRKAGMLLVICILAAGLIAGSGLAAISESQPSARASESQAIEAAGSITASEAVDLPAETIPAGITKDEIDSSLTAQAKTAWGDSLRIDNLERPFTQSEMAYHPETDIVNVTIAEDATHYYFAFELSGGAEDSGYPSAFYGIEFDTDLDLKGDLLLWVKGGETVEWTSEGVTLYKDANNDVGGAIAVLPDPFSGDGYETVAFLGEEQAESALAWQRSADGAANIIHLALLKTEISRDYFFWKAWADAGAADPALFDYNDAFSNTQAGSPDKTNSVYPVNELELVDSTCWVAYGFQPTREQTGCCYRAPAKVKPQRSEEPEPGV